VSNAVDTKIKTLFDLHVPDTVMLASWLESKGYSYDLQQRYRKSDWLQSIGVGAFKRPKETITWHGGLSSLQQQANFPVHAGGLTALSLLGVSHFIRPGRETVFLFTPKNRNLPSWFRNYDWDVEIDHKRTSFLPDDLAITQHNIMKYGISISSAERAFFECLYHSPGKMDLLECYQIMSGMVNLRPRIIQKLLDQCTSIKVKRLFLYMAEKANHQWFEYINTEGIDLGKGDRSIVKNGTYILKYKITVPKELDNL
jgi:Transcriptional regulator, AbiEi antitoxin, Type IV TA system/Transcriptional regulator, AbiEi antitoxin N-terminal domain